MSDLLNKRLARSLWRTKLRLSAVFLMVFVGVFAGITFGGYAYNLGGMYANGDGVPQDLSEALRWLHKSDAQGFEHAAGLIQQILTVRRQQQAAPQPPPPPSQLPPILIDCKVELHGLKAKPERNGQLGLVVAAAFVSSTGRCSVQLDDGSGPFKIKLGNLREL